jgi:hypothetical protein
MAPTSSKALSAKVTRAGHETLLKAEEKNFLGRFRVMLNQIQPHPLQRTISSDWVRSLKDHFLEVGIDRAAYPVKVLLKDDSIWDSQSTGLMASGKESLPVMPENVGLLVYDGQHRIAACSELGDLEEKWWYALVYRRGELAWNIAPIFLDQVQLLSTTILLNSCLQCMPQMRTRFARWPMM